MCKVCEPLLFPLGEIPEDCFEEAEYLMVHDFRGELDFETGGICPFCGEAYPKKEEDEDEEFNF